tara:strand:+ start:572 stop:694 length:123 start_codon:yes stop_codon:yes gene_type:complete
MKKLFALSVLVLVLPAAAVTSKTNTVEVLEPPVAVLVETL